MTRRKPQTFWVWRDDALNQYYTSSFGMRGDWACSWPGRWVRVRLVQVRPRKRVKR